MRAGAFAAALLVALGCGGLVPVPDVTDAGTDMSDDARCGPAWADTPAPDPATSRACVEYWMREVYGSLDPDVLDLDPVPGLAAEQDLTAAQLRRMASFASAVAPADAAPSDPAVRAARYFLAAAEHRFRIGQDANLVSFEPQLARVLAGEALTDDDLQPYGDLRWDDVVLWRLEAAVHARHGKRFDHPDLQRFFYAPGAVEGTELLPLRDQPGYRPDALTEVDRANIDRIRAHRGQHRR